MDVSGGTGIIKTALPFVLLQKTKSGDLWRYGSQITQNEKTARDGENGVQTIQSGVEDELWSTQADRQQSQNGQAAGTPTRH